MSSRRGRSSGSGSGSGSRRRGQKRSEAIDEKLQQLGSLVNSAAVNAESIIVDASRYIEELQERVEKKHQDVRENGISQITSSSHHDHDDHHHHQISPTPMVNVETLVDDPKGFLINVFSENNCSGLLLSILEGLEELGLEVQDASVSCSDSFRLQAAVNEKEGEVESTIDAKVVENVVLQAISNWPEW